MATVQGKLHQHRPPQWPVGILAICAILATLSIFQGFIDVVLPAIRGEPTFGFLFHATAKWGPAFFVGWIFIHNLGLACLVPGIGFLAAPFEKRTENRALIGALLAGAVFFSFLVAAQYMITAQERFDARIVIPLFAGEALSISALAIAGAMELRGFVPTRTYEWSLVTPFRRMRWVLATTASLLFLLATLEAYVLLRP